MEANIYIIIHDGVIFLVRKDRTHWMKKYVYKHKDPPSSLSKIKIRILLAKYYVHAVAYV